MTEPIRSITFASNNVKMCFNKWILSFLSSGSRCRNKDQDSAYTVGTYGVLHWCALFSHWCPVLFVHFKKQKYKKSGARIFSVREYVLIDHSLYVL